MKIRVVFLYFLPFLFGCKSEEYFTNTQLGADVTLRIINTYLEKECLPVNEKLNRRRSTDLIKVLDTLRWRSYYGEKVQEFVTKNNVRVSEDPVVLSVMNSNYPIFFQNRVQLVNNIAREDYCGTYSFSPAFRTANENEYMIQIFFDSFEMDYGRVFVFEFENNSFRIKEELDSWLRFF